MNTTFFTEKKLWIPVILAITIFIVDKLSGLKSIRRFTETRIESSFYNEKENLLKQLKRYNEIKSKENKLLVLFGTSHMGEFSHAYMAKKIPELTTYNFSAPMAPPSYLYYNLITIQRENIPIDYAILEIIPETFRDEANEYALKYSYDWRFMRENWKDFSRDDIETFSRANLFSVMRYPIRLDTAFTRIKSGSASQLEILQSLVKLANVQNNGGIPNPIIYEVPESFFEKEAKKFYDASYYNYKESPTQLKFLYKFIENCKQNNIKLILYKPTVSKELQTLLDASPFYQKWMEDKSKLAKENNLPFLDVSQKSESIKCKKFVDVHHLSGGCYPEVMDIVIDAIKDFN
jgi:hypothetical protein